MKTISLSVSEKDYEAFRVESVRAGRSIASLIRDAMSEYRDAMGGGRKLTRVRPFEGVGPVIGRGRGGKK